MFGSIFYIKGFEILLLEYRQLDLDLDFKSIDSFSQLFSQTFLHFNFSNILNTYKQGTYKSIITPFELYILKTMLTQEH